jgi:hypothetical protein
MNGSKRIARTWDMTKDVVVQDLTEPMKVFRKCGIWYIQTFNQSYYVEIMKQLRGAVRIRPELWSNDWILYHDSAPVHKALCQAVSSTKIASWTTTPNLFPWFDSQRLLAIIRNKVCFKDMKISGYRTPPNKHGTTALKTMPQQEFQKCFYQFEYHSVSS